MSKTLVVVVPIYKSTLSETERVSVSRLFKVLKDRVVVMVKPEGLDTSNIEQEYPFSGVETFESDYFKSIKGYNRLLLSSEFYSRFGSYDYMLVCQTDVYVFHDDLNSWMDKGYDYVGAPWISSNKVSNFIHWVKMTMSKCFFGQRNIVYRYETRNKVGNGGFSLRKVATHILLSVELKEQITHYLNNQGTHYFNEDIFWSIEPSKNGLEHSTPTASEAITFAFDINPKRLYRKNGYQVPMAAHGWNKSRCIDFWTPLIDRADS